MSIDQRIFIVGCPRSGTTLLQKHLAAHPEIHSFPESHFFTRPPQHVLLKMLGLHSRAKKRAYQDFIKAVGGSLDDMPMPWYAKFKPLSTPFFIRTLDTLAKQAGKHIWLEKTPGHVFSIPWLSRAAKPCKFIHIVRDGREVAASLREVSVEHPKRWHGPLSASDCIAKWNHALLQTCRWSGHPDHHVVRFERFVADPAGHLSAICGFLNLDYDACLLTPGSSMAAGLVTPEEKWKAKSMSNEIITIPVSKFTQVFSEQEQKVIDAEILDADSLLS